MVCAPVVSQATRSMVAAPSPCKECYSIARPPHPIAFYLIMYTKTPGWREAGQVATDIHAKCLMCQPCGLVLTPDNLCIYYMHHSTMHQLLNLYVKQKIPLIELGNFSNIQTVTEIKFKACGIRDSWIVSVSVCWLSWYSLV